MECEFALQSLEVLQVQTKHFTPQARSNPIPAITEVLTHENHRRGLNPSMGCLERTSEEAKVPTLIRDSDENIEPVLQKNASRPLVEPVQVCSSVSTSNSQPSPIAYRTVNGQPDPRYVLAKDLELSESSSEDEDTESHEQPCVQNSSIALKKRENEDAAQVSGDPFSSESHLHEIDPKSHDDGAGSENFSSEVINALEESDGREHIRSSMRCLESSLNLSTINFENENEGVCPKTTSAAMGVIDASEQLGNRKPSSSGSTQCRDQTSEPMTSLYVQQPENLLISNRQISESENSSVSVDQCARERQVCEMSARPERARKKKNSGPVETSMSQKTVLDPTVSESVLSENSGDVYAVSLEGGGGGPEHDSRYSASSLQSKKRKSVESARLESHKSETEPKPFALYEHKRASNRFCWGLTLSDAAEQARCEKKETTYEFFLNAGLELKRAGRAENSDEAKVGTVLRSALFFLLAGA